VACLGWPLYRFTVALLGLAVGAGLAGWIGWLAGGERGAFIAAFIGGLCGAIVAWPTEVFLRTMCGALAGMALGLAAGSWLGGSGPMAGGALGGLLLGGGLTFLLYRPVVMLFSAVLGSLAAVYGALSAWRPGEVLQFRPAFAGAAAGLAILGYLVQRAIDAAARRKQR
jgi:hypothetical protein